MKIKKLNIQSCISIDDKQRIQDRISCHSESLFTVTIQGIKTSSSMAYPFKKYNIFDCSCLQTKPKELEFQKALAFAFYISLPC